MIKNLIPKFDNIIIVGGMANNILDYLGNPIGKSIKENNCKSIIDDIFKTAKINSCSVIIGNESGPICLGASLKKKFILYTFPFIQGQKARL